MSKTKVRRTMTCGGCGGTGHNTRTCKGAPAESPTVTVSAPVATVAEAVKTKVEVPPPPVPKKIRVDTRPERPRREAPTADRGTAATAAPYRCPKCNSVAILAIVRVKDYVVSLRTGKEAFKGDQRCEQCLNKPDPALLILKWGAKPGETVTEEQANAVL